MTEAAQASHPAAVLSEREIENEKLTMAQAESTTS